MRFIRSSPIPSRDHRERSPQSAFGFGVEFGRDARQRQTQIIKQQPREQDASSSHHRPTQFETRARLGRDSPRHATDAHHAPLMLRHALAAEKSLTGRTLDGCFPQSVIGTALVNDIHRRRRS
jgi:hypothetical protein